MVTHALLTVLTSRVEQIKVLSGQISDQLAARADEHIFTSLLRSGRVRTARLLAETGDCRTRFPTPEPLACLAGAAPSTRQSGKLRSVGLRWSCDKQLLDAVIDFAADLYHRARARGHDHPVGDPAAVTAQRMIRVEPWAIRADHGSELDPDRLQQARWHGGHEASQ